MEPRIQYARTSDGVHIAYATFGEGPPLVYLSSFLAGVHNYVGFEPARNHVDALANAGWQVIRFDGRGTGSSDRDALDFSLDVRLRDLEAVVDRLKLQQFALLGRSQGSLVAIAYAAQRPERISRLVLVQPFTSGAFEDTSGRSRALKAMRPLFGQHWELMSLNVAYLSFGFQDRESAESLAVSYRTGITGDAYRAMVEAEDEIDVSGCLGSITVPTLVVQDTSLLGRTLLSRGDQAGAGARKIAARIPNARLISTDDPDGTVNRFLDVDRDAALAVGAESSLPSGTAIILFADIADSTALTERLGDTAFRAKARKLDASLRTAIRDHAGTPIEGKLLGDGALAVFTSARQAIEAALACARSGDEAGLPLHLGLHAGDVIREENNVYGGAVNIAARISGLSAPGEVLVSETVRSLARTSAGVRFEDRGEQSLKGVGEKVRVWAVWEGE
jgi:class 3 adenylate cyclase